MIEPDQYEEWYTYMRYEYAKMSSDELAVLLSLIVDVCKGGSKKRTKRHITELRKRWDMRRISVKYRAVKDELASRFSRESTHDLVGYDS